MSLLGANSQADLPWKQAATTAEMRAEPSAHSDSPLLARSHPLVHCCGQTVSLRVATVSPGAMRLAEVRTTRRVDSSRQTQVPPSSSATSAGIAPVGSKWPGLVLRPLSRRLPGGFLDA